MIYIKKQENSKWHIATSPTGSAACGVGPGSGGARWVFIEAEGKKLDDGDVCSLCKQRVTGRRGAFDTATFGNVIGAR